MGTRAGSARAGAWWGDEPPTARRIKKLSDAGEILDGVLREAREHDAAYRMRAAPRLPHTVRPVALVADPDAAWRLVCQEALERLGGFCVVPAGDGAEAWAMITSAGADIVLADFALPCTRGEELATRLKADEHTRHIPLVLLAGSAATVPRAVRLSCDAFLMKPCAPAELCRLAIVMVAARRESANDPPIERSAPARTTSPGGAEARVPRGRAPERS